MAKKHIIMADIIGSRIHNDKKLMVEFSNAVKLVNFKFKRKLLSPLTITLGDEFQGITDSFQTSIEIVFVLEEWIFTSGCKFRLRYVMNYGNVGTAVNTKTSYAMLGQGLTDARQMIQNLKPSKERFLISTSQKQKTALLNDAFRLYAFITNRWATKDAQTILAFINGKDYATAADELKKNRSLIWKRYRSLAMNEYFTAKRIISNLAAQ